MLVIADKEIFDDTLERSIINFEKVDQMISYHCCWAQSLLLYKCCMLILQAEMEGFVLHPYLSQQEGHRRHVMDCYYLRKATWEIFVLFCNKIQKWE